MSKVKNSVIAWLILHVKVARRIAHIIAYHKHHNKQYYLAHVSR